MTDKPLGSELTERGGPDWSGLAFVLLATVLLTPLGIWFEFGWPLSNAPFGGIVGIWCWVFGLSTTAFVVATFRKSLWINALVVGIAATVLVAVVWFAASFTAHQFGWAAPHVPMLTGEQ
jgi:hypothetical protein